MDKIKKWLKKPIVERALKTFVQAFCSYIAINIMTTDLTQNKALLGLLAGAIGSALSVLMNINKKEDAIDE